MKYGLYYKDDEYKIEPKYVITVKNGGENIYIGTGNGTTTDFENEKVIDVLEFLHSQNILPRNVYMKSKIYSDVNDPINRHITMTIITSQSRHRNIIPRHRKQDPLLPNTDNLSELEQLTRHLRETLETQSKNNGISVEESINIGRTGENKIFQSFPNGMADEKVTVFIE